LSLGERIRKPVFVVTPRTLIRKDGNVLIFELREKKERLPVGVVEHLFVFGGVEITTRALRFLLSNGRYVFYLNSFGKLVGLSVPEILTSDNGLRALQYLAFADEKFKVELTRELLKRKLEIAFLELHSLYKAFALKPQSLNEWKLSLEASLLKADSLDSFLGIDGALSKYLYDRFSGFNESPFYFNGRNYYPPEDPVNAVLSLSFSILYALLFPLLISKGLDPYCGFFHVKRGRHASLCSDLLEVSRPLLIRFVFEAFNNGFFEKEDFFSEARGVKIKREPLKAFLKFYLEEVILNEDERYFRPIKDFINHLTERLRKR